MILAGSRIVYGMSKSGSIPHVFSKVHYKTRTPWIAIILISLASIGFLFIGEIDFLASVTNYTLFASFIFINASAVVLRYTSPNTERSFKNTFKYQMGSNFTNFGHNYMYTTTLKSRIQCYSFRSHINSNRYFNFLFKKKIEVLKSVK